MLLSGFCFVGSLSCVWLTMFSSPNASDSTQEGTSLQLLNWSSGLTLTDTISCMNVSPNEFSITCA